MKKIEIVRLSSFIIAWSLVIFGANLYSCSAKKGKEKTVARWETPKNKPGETQETITEDIFKEYHVTYKSVYTDSSYWFVQLKFIREGGETMVHGVVALPMPYFDFNEALKQFSRKGEVYFNYFQQITKEGYDSFKKYADNNDLYIKAEG